MPVISRRFINTVATLAFSGLILMGSGCTSQSRAKGAQSPPPPTLSAPVRAEEAVARSAPAAEAVPADEYAFLSQRQAKHPVGTRQPLPMVKVPAITPQAAVIPPQPPASRENVVSSHYVMQKGDTLYAIARKFNVPPKKLIAANSFKNPNKLPVGTRVHIPSAN